MANTFKFGNGNWATKEDSVLAYNDENNNFKPLPFDFTRASTATYVDSDGLIKTSKQGEARIDYTDSSDGALLLEPSRTNLLPYSNDFSQSDWNKSSATITDSSLTSPDGNLNVSTLTTSASGATVQDAPSVSDGYVTFSVFVKKGTTDGVRIRIDAATDSNGFFDLVNNNVHSSTNDAKIEDYGNGWYRISISADITSFVKAAIYTTDGTTSYDNGTVHIYGAQLELGSYATSYIPTNGSSVTRVEETCSNSGNSEVFNDSEGVLYANISALADDGTSRRITITDNSGDNFYNIVSLELDEASNNLKAFISNSTTITAFLFTSLNQSENNKIALKYNSSSADLFVNGFNVQTHQTPNLPTGLVSLDFNNGKVPSGSDFYGKTKELGYYDTALTDLELETLTSYTSWGVYGKRIKFKYNIQWLTH